MLITTTPEQDTRLKSWSEATGELPEVLVKAALDEALSDWEDYTDALRICADVDAGRMKVYSLEEVERRLNELDGLEG